MIDKTFAWLFLTMERLNRKYSRFGTPPFFDPEVFDWIPALRARTAEIQAELDALLLRAACLPNFQDLSPDQRALTLDAGWKTFFFRAYGADVEKNLAHCPNTAAALKLIPGCMTAMFSIFAPGKRLPPHHGPYCGVLRLHLGVRIPTRDPRQCAIRVDQATRAWANGEVLVFDDRYLHDAWNLTDQYRVVLFVDFLRPLPWPVHVLNRAMVWLISKTRFVTVAARNQAQWEAAFYGDEP